MKKAFTLAEVLITLGIIGIVAEITIPTLMQKFQEQATAAQLKKEYSILSSAYTLAVQENGTPDAWNLVAGGDCTGATNMLNALGKYLKIINNCGTAPGCWPNLNYKNLVNDASFSNNNYDANTSMAKAQLADGSIIRTYVTQESCAAPSYGTGQALNSVCGSIAVDINGFKKPNQWGVDTFYFYVTKSGLIPYGTAQETKFGFSSYCSTADTTLISGVGCAAWVIYNGNMDYRYCSGLSWNGPTKCP